MRAAKAKAILKRSLDVEQAVGSLSMISITVTNRCTLLWVAHRQSYGIVNDYINNIVDYIFADLLVADVYVLFDRYFEFIT